MLLFNYDMFPFAVKDIVTALKTFGSNIIFSNGLLDPWSGGRYTEDILATLAVVSILSSDSC